MEFPGTAALKGKGVFSSLSPQGLSPVGGHPAFWSLGLGWDGPSSSELRQALAHGLSLEDLLCSVTILVSLSQGMTAWERSISFSHILTPHLKAVLGALVLCGRKSLKVLVSHQGLHLRDRSQGCR